MSLFYYPDLGYVSLDFEELSPVCQSMVLG